MGICFRKIFLATTLDKRFPANRNNYFLTKCKNKNTVRVRRKMDRIIGVMVKSGYRGESYSRFGLEEQRDTGANMGAAAVLCSFAEQRWELWCQTMDHNFSP